MPRTARWMHPRGLPAPTLHAPARPQLAGCGPLSAPERASPPPLPPSLPQILRHPCFEGLVRAAHRRALHMSDVELGGELSICCAALARVLLCCGCGFGLGGAPPPAAQWLPGERRKVWGECRADVSVVRLSPTEPTAAPSLCPLLPPPAEVARACAALQYPKSAAAAQVC